MFVCVAPVITDISPQSLDTIGGELVVLSGSSFGSNAWVYFDGEF